jgi:hypothetical protein
VYAVLTKLANNSMQSRAASAADTEPGSPASKYLTAYAFEADAFEEIGWTTAPISIFREPDAIRVCDRRVLPIARTFPPTNYDEPCGSYTDFKFAASGKLNDFLLDGTDARGRAHYWPPGPQQPSARTSDGLDAHLLSVIANPDGHLDIVVIVHNGSKHGVSWLGPHEHLSALRGTPGAEKPPSSKYAEANKCFRPGLWATPAIQPGYSARLLLGFTNARFGGTLELVSNTGSVMRLRITENRSSAPDATACSAASG